MDKHGKTAKSWRGELNPLRVAWESPCEWEWVRKWKEWVHNGLGMLSQAFTCPTSQKHTFQKWVTSQIRIWPPCLSHPKEITSSTTFRWPGTKRQKKGSWQIYGFYLRHLDFPHRLKVWIISPPYSLWNHAPISLTLWCIASCGILLIFILHDVSNILCPTST